MDIFADISHDQAMAFTALLKTITTDDCRRLSDDQRTIQEAMQATTEIIRAFEEMGFKTA